MGKSAASRWFAVLCATAAFLAGTCAWAQVMVGEHRGAQYPVERPTLEISSWLGVGGGGRPSGQEPRGLFDLRLGGDVTLPMGRQGDLRVGPFAEAGTATFASISAVGGLELFVGAVPRPLRMFYYPGEGTLVVRPGAGVGSWRDLPEATFAPVASLTVAYGYRAPFSLREVSEQVADEPRHRDAARYMVGVRLWANATVGFAASRIWQISGGIEFEPVGSFRYILGLY